MKILVTGANGQLGCEVAKQGREQELVLTDCDTLNITDGIAVAKCMRDIKPDAVIHCAAYTNVDGAETDEDAAFRVNVVGAQNLAAGCLETGARMVYVSTDYVFDGTGRKAYREFDMVNPQTVYGRTKWQGEEMVRQILSRHYIVRTAWLYGEGNNFVRTMLRLANEQNTLRVVNDQIGSPTSTVDLATVIFKLLQTDGYGTYHATCQGHCSWYDFACEIFRQAGKQVKVEPVTTAEFPRPAKRPAYSVLDNYMLRMTIGDPVRGWQEALQVYLKNHSSC
ncbi:dTDP-4-dehydrorhamnose reductase [Sporomusa acidovorans]|uniref:dTDP-4-dehydrorhamnose reductase n=1 Tax=Sporomusa acidovorans (strain ATCC 49682 / DSM 3132 / Mol) TaxID=1123286 RepID=A0ABZ3J6X3_SPOA4|nr:dTDP-4-dehydrorhamnose reductase [Sporomusa acidovorans]OZC19363.1 dTDP-4-dehydrorhamnose reductase [Sporomusa acidovorans DSM 3132]SDD79376.1 dTDP-4-dehydrorhamnose reductase [Sporomusa acidovorans]